MTDVHDRRGGDALVGLGPMVRLLMRRDRVKLPAWTGGLAGFALYVTVAIPAAYGSDDDLASISGIFTDPVGRLLVGPGHGLDEPTVARFVTNGYGLYLMIVAAVMNILLVVRHTRGEEQTGRAELVRANVVGRHTSLAATVVVALLTNVVAGIGVWAVLVVVGGHGVAGSLVFGSSIAALGLAFAGVTATTAQLTSSARAAAGIAGGVLGAAFVLRAGGDMARQGGSALSWTSALGWAQQTAPFVHDRWWPLLPLIVLAAATTVAGFWLSRHRDVGASLFAVRPGPPRAHPALGTPLGLALRLQRAAIVGWGAALAVSGIVFGAFADPLLDAIDDMPDVFRDVFGTDDLLAGYLAYMATFMAFLTAAYCVLAVQGYRDEEAGGRGEPLLATPVSRRAWLGANVAATALGAFAILLVTGITTGVGAAVATGDRRHVAELTGAHLNAVPSVLVTLGVAVLLYGVRSRAVPLAWAIVGYGVVVGTFGSLVGLPDIAFGVSPFEHHAAVPLDAFAPLPIAILTTATVVSATAGVLAFERRDLDTT